MKRPTLGSRMVEDKTRQRPCSIQSFLLLQVPLLISQHVFHSKLNSRPFKNSTHAYTGVHAFLNSLRNQAVPSHIFLSRIFAGRRSLVSATALDDKLMLCALI